MTTDFSDSLTCTVPPPTYFTQFIIEATEFFLNSIYKSGYRYPKVGIMMLDFIPASLEQRNPFVNFTHRPYYRWMNIVDHIKKESRTEKMKSLVLNSRQ